jgi:adenine-specific DNA-methyltransferase
MKKLTLNDPEARSIDVLAGNIQQLRGLFPEVFTEGGIDFDVLKQLLGGALEEREEKYGLNWCGKRRARQAALTSSVGTLRPCPTNSVDWDTTQNLLIEGDNLEVLKLLQKSYSGKVKLIYIDPPYNTGNDFVYPDKYDDNLATYLRYTGQVNDEGFKVSSNTESSGRFHTNWLNMMYPRLKVARNLMRGDAAIYISIDDREVANLRAICDEVFGEEQFVSNFIWEKRTNRENRKTISGRHDNILCYCRDISLVGETIRQLPMSEKALANYKNPDNDPRGPWKSDPATAQAGHGTKSQFYSFEAPNGTVHELESGRCWLFTKPVMEQAAREGRLWFGKDGRGVPRIKTYLDAKERGLTPESIWFADEVGTNESAKNALKELFDERAVFDSPKPVDLIRQMILLTAPGGIVLDFFAGAGSAGHAVLAQNALDEGQRRFLLVQLPEPTPEGSEAMRSGLETVSAITTERLRRAGKEIRKDNPAFKGDLGFRVFKLDASNMRAWEPDRGNMPKTLEESVDHLRANRTEADILYELLLKLGLDLCVPIEKKKISGKDVHSVGGGVLLACLAGRITRDQVEPLAEGIVNWHKTLAPAGDTTCVFRDNAFADDVAKTNLAAILNQHGLANVRSL